MFDQAYKLLPANASFGGIARIFYPRSKTDITLP
jgi:hypothetical protein